MNDCQARCVILWLWPCSDFKVLKFVTVLRGCCILRNIKKRAFRATLLELHLRLLVLVTRDSATVILGSVQTKCDSAQELGEETTKYE